MEWGLAASEEGWAEDIDRTDIPAFDAPATPVKARQPSYTFISAAASVAAHALLIAGAWWAVAASRPSLRAEGSGGENGDLGFADTADLAVHQGGQPSDVPPVFALPSDGSEAAPPSRAGSVPADPRDRAAEPDPVAGAEPLFAPGPDEWPLESEPEEPPPLIGLAAQGISVPRRATKAPPVLRRPQSATPPVAVADGRSGASAAAAAPPADPSDGVASEGTGGEAPPAPADRRGQTDGTSPAGPAAAAAYTPARPAGAAGGGAATGRRGRRGARGLDGRGLPVPDYPPASRRRGEEGLVVLEVEVREDGSVGGVRVTGSSGHRRLDEAAAEAVRRAAFTPALLGGRAVPGVVVVPYRFRLD